MNCDDAFDALTDPQRRGNAELQQHLARCVRCRQMEETLSPALHLFEVDPGTVGPSHYGTAGSGAAGESSAAPALQSQSRNFARDGRHVWSVGRTSRTRSQLLAVAVTTFVLLGIASSWMSPNAGLAPAPRVAFAVDDCSWLRPETVGSLPGDGASAHVVAGCVACHLGEGRSAARVQMLACVQCHAESAGLALETPAEGLPNGALRSAPPVPANAACSWLRISG